jgi:hypothetical protein
MSEVADVDDFENHAACQLNLGTNAELLNVAGALVLILPVGFLDIQRRR